MILCSHQTDVSVAKPPAAKGFQPGRRLLPRFGLFIRGCMSEQLTKVFVYTLAIAVAQYLFFKPDGKR